MFNMASVISLFFELAKAQNDPLVFMSQYCESLLLLQVITEHGKLINNDYTLIHFSKLK